MFHFFIVIENEKHTQVNKKKPTVPPVLLLVVQPRLIRNACDRPFFMDLLLTTKTQGRKAVYFLRLTTSHCLFCSLTTPPSLGHLIAQLASADPSVARWRQVCGIHRCHKQDKSLASCRIGVVMAWFHDAMLQGRNGAARPNFCAHAEDKNCTPCWWEWNGIPGASQSNLKARCVLVWKDNAWSGSSNAW